MRIVQVVSPAATVFEQKCQRVDFELLSGEHEVVVTPAARRLPHADIVHFYGTKPRIMRPKTRWFARERAIAVSPLDNLPEAVEEVWFAGRRLPSAEVSRTIGSLSRRSLEKIVEQTVPRLHRTREDIEWLTFDAPPTPEEFAAIDVWIDPATDEDDFDGFVAEAIVSGIPVVASRTPINAQRLENGRTGFLVRPNDANELTHAILSALFKPEVAQQKINAARQTMPKFRPRQRLRVLSKLYESLQQ